MQIQANMKMAEMIHVNYHLLMIISRFGINLGFGDKSVGQVCSENKIDVNFFLEIVNSYHNKNYFPKKHLQEFSLNLIVDYLRKSHNYYLNTKIPQITSLLNQLAKITNTGANPTLKLIDTFFTEYKNELSVHIQREEDKVYPYVFGIEKAFMERNPDSNIVHQIKQYSIDDYEYEHENVEDKLLDLKNILIKYIPVPVDSDLSQAILFELFRLEADLRDHARMEDKILVPKVKYMEKWILDHYSA
jgi:regulator of cell morphogenesis and NO signaling